MPATLLKRDSNTGVFLLILRNFLKRKKAYWTLVTEAIRICPGGIMTVSLDIGHKLDICDALHDLVLFVQFKKRGKHPWRNVTLSLKPATLLKVTLLHGCFSRFLNCINGTKCSLNLYYVSREVSWYKKKPLKFLLERV